MRLPLLAAAALLVASPTPAFAQLASRSISLETGLSTPVAGRGPASAALALAASTWLADLDVGSLDGVLRVAWSSARETPDRAAADAFAATAGLRLSLGRAPVRPQLFADLGWCWWLRGSGAGDGLALGLGAGVEWFPATDVSISACAALRGTGSDAAGEGVLALAAYF